MDNKITLVIGRLTPLLPPVNSAKLALRRGISILFYSTAVQQRLTRLLVNPYNPADSRNSNTRNSIRHGWREEEKMLRIVSLQLMATVVAGIVAALLGGWPAMFSAVFGGLCCVVPNGLFALRLFANAQRIGAANPMSFFIGEFIKIALTVTLLGVTAWLYRDLNWLALLCGFIVALKSYIILLFRHHK
jgi:ATP synthase protein I